MSPPPGPTTGSVTQPITGTITRPITRPGLALIVYALVTRAIEPLAPALLAARARRGKEDPARLGERLGRPSRSRSPGPLVWLHGASVGETLSVLPLIQAMQAARPELTLLATSGTVTSATLLAERLPAGLAHQFLPVDVPGAMGRFLDHWRPDLAVFVESEVWPNALQALRRRGARTALVSARLSPASVERWGRAARSAAHLFGGFELVLAQDDAAAGRLGPLGARDDGRLNLKLIGAPPPADDEALAQARLALGPRPVLLAASTHDGEEAMALDVFAWLKDRPDHPLLILVPRHPARGEAVASLARAEGFRVAQRGRAQPLTEAVQVYVADTLGELGLWLRLARAALIGGSLVQGIGGHNPLEAARLGCPAIAGPYVDNWRSVYCALEADQAVRTVGGVSMLAGAFAEALSDPTALQSQAARAKAFAERQSVGLASACDRLLAMVARPSDGFVTAEAG